MEFDVSSIYLFARATILF